MRSKSRDCAWWLARARAWAMALAMGAALLSGVARADMPVFKEDFEGQVVGPAAGGKFLSVVGNGLVAAGQTGNAGRYFESGPSGATGLSIVGCSAEDDFNLRFAFSAGGDAGSSHLYLSGSFGGGESLQIGYRKQGAGMRLVVGHDGGTRGSEAAIPGLTDYNQWAMVHVLRVGRSIKVNAWPCGAAEPAGWMVDARIGAHVAGGGGMQWRFRQFRVDDIESLPVPEEARREQAAAEQRIEDAVLVEADAAIPRVRQGDLAVVVVNAAGEPVPGAKVEVELLRHEFLFGCNVMNYIEGLKTDEQRQTYQRRFAELFNYGTVGFYWHWFEKEKDRPDFPLNDRIIAWCRSKGITVKGHPLLWDSWMGVPMWMGKDARQPPPEAQRRHVEEVLRHYAGPRPSEAGQVEYWEVVNEPASVSGIRIDEAYRWARAADPKTRLIVNDYRVLDNGFPPFYDLLAKAIAAGVPFDGVGIQAHVPDNKRFPLDGVRQTLDQYARLGKGGLLTAELEPKPAYEALRKLIHEQWHTRVAGQSDPRGRLAFRGFYGEYTVKVNGQPAGGTFRLARPAEAPASAPSAEWRVQLPAGGR